MKYVLYFKADILSGQIFKCCICCCLEMIAEIETRLFIDGVDKKGKNTVYCLNSLDRNYFRYARFDQLTLFTLMWTFLVDLRFCFICCVIRSAGEIMAVSLAQGGPPPFFFLREWCFQYLCSGDYDSIQVTTSDVTDLEFSLLIEKVKF